ncbi:MAG: NAD-dependent DNA ligase LigA [Defluviitaleaceae bacterium]|nr:NAD-dependent DNA ligase LigA [Defluviitaleaceae bacterium]
MKTERIQELVRQLNVANRAYYQENREIMTDREYDALYDELAQLEAETGITLAGSPTMQVGHQVVSALKKAEHDSPMLSLDKTKSPEALAGFLGVHEGLLSWKLDGLTVVLKYENGQLQQALTRGNGRVGEDVTHNARVFVNIPLSLPFVGNLQIRGEAVITFADFEAINAAQEDGETYKNPRNLCSGAVRQLNSQVTAKRRVHFYAFGLIGSEEFAKKAHELEWLKSLGFDVVDYSLVTAQNIVAEVEAYKTKIPSLPWATDGLVLTFDDIAHSKSLGATSKFPRDSIAFKWADELAETRLLSIEWNTSRTGLINPIAVFEPVEIEGTTVSRAGLHNVSILQGLQLIPGDNITVYKANMIIPQVAENLSVPKDDPGVGQLSLFSAESATRQVEIPQACPVCNQPTEIIGDPEMLYCTNPGCGTKLILTLTHFVSRDAMNIEGLSEQTLGKFIASGFVNEYPDLFEIAKYEQEITSTEGFGRKSFDNLIAAIEAAKDTALPNFIFALGIRDVGLANAKLLCAHFNHDMEAIVDEAAKPVPTVFEDVLGIGDVSAERLREYFASPVGEMPLSEKLQGSLLQHFNNDEAAISKAAKFTPADKPFGAIKGFGKEIIANLQDYFTDAGNLACIWKVLPLLRLQKPKTEGNQPLAGLTFVVTGDVVQFKNRKALQELIESQGGKVAGSVSAKTSYLINNDAASTSGKNKKAAMLGVPVVTEDEFIEKFQG